jgi:hypothetical protein
MAGNGSELSAIAKQIAFGDERLTRDSECYVWVNERHGHRHLKWTTTALNDSE